MIQSIKSNSGCTLQSHPRMEKRIHPPCRFVADPWCSLQIGEPRHLHPPRRAEVVEQCALACRTDAGNLVQLALPDVLRAPRAMRADSETMRLVAQPLQEIQHRIARR